MEGRWECWLVEVTKPEGYAGLGAASAPTMREEIQGIAERCGAYLHPNQPLDSVLIHAGGLGTARQLEKELEALRERFLFEVVFHLLAEDDGRIVPVLMTPDLDQVPEN